MRARLVAARLRPRRVVPAATLRRMSGAEYEIPFGEAGLEGEVLPFMVHADVFAAATGEPRVYRLPPDSPEPQNGELPATPASPPNGGAHAAAEKGPGKSSDAAEQLKQLRALAAGGVAGLEDAIAALAASVEGAARSADPPKAPRRQDAPQPDPPRAAGGGKREPLKAPASQKPPAPSSSPTQPRRVAATPSRAAPKLNYRSVPKPFTEIPRMSPSDFRDSAALLELDHPVILGPDLIEGWPLRQAALQGRARQFVRERCGDVVVSQMKLEGDGEDSAAYADHVRNAYVRPVRKPAPILLRDCMAPDPLEDHIFVIDKGGPAARLLDSGDVWIPKILSKPPLTLARMDFSVGPDNDGVMFHTHGATWLAVVYGRKRWYYYPPDGFRGEAYEKLSLLPSCRLTSAVASLPPELRPIEVVQEPGEVMFLPDGWWHATVNIGESMMIGGQRVETADNRRAPWWAVEGTKRWPQAGILQQLTADGLWHEYGDLAQDEVQQAQASSPAVAETRLRRREILREALYRQAIASEAEPFNIRFSTALIEMLSQEEMIDPVSIRSYAISTFGTAKRNMQLGQFCAKEYAQITAQLAESLSNYVDGAATRLQVQAMQEAGMSPADVSSRPEPLPELVGVLKKLGLRLRSQDARAGFNNLLQVCSATREFLDEALDADADNELAAALMANINKSAASSEAKDPFPYLK